MYDKRIVRGNTYALHTLPAVSDVLGNSDRGVIYSASDVTVRTAQST